MTQKHLAAIFGALMSASRLPLPASTLWLIGMCLATPFSVAAQTSQQLEFVRSNPQLVRQQLMQSGLTQEQIRQRLQSAGLPANLMDRFLQPGADTTGAPALGDETLRALEVLGVARLRADGLEFVPVDTGYVVRVIPAREAERGLQLFGLEVFRGPTTRFQPVLSGPVPPTYKVGPGDLLVLVLTGDVETVQELSVTREGFTLIPQVGQIFVSNLSMEQLNQLLRQRLGRSYSGIRTGTTRFDVTVARLRTNQVFVIGEVAQPGAFQLASVATVLNAIYAAGGLTQRANFRDIAVRRQGAVVATLDLYDYLLRGDTKRDIVLEQGDVVFVPVRGIRASISGAVIRPAIYELKAGETLEDLIRASGGFQAEADLKRLAVHRIVPAVERAPGPLPRAVVDVELRGREGADGVPDLFRNVVVPALGMIDGDSVVVDSITVPGRSLTVSIVGMVRKAGTYPWREGMTIRDLVALARGPVVGADLREAEIARLPSDRSRGQLAEAIRVSLDSSYLFERNPGGEYLGATGVSFPPAGQAPEVPLVPYDQVTIFEQPQFELQRPVQITGEVAYPGMYALTRKDERVSDLVRRAGGSLPTAHVEGARFYRSQDQAGRVNVEVGLALSRPGTAADAVLQPGDSVHIPELNPTVRVEGAVNSPTSVLFREGAGLDYYIANAGGYARNADKGLVSVRYANGSAKVVGRFLFFRSKPPPAPGSTVTVPSKPEGEPFNVTQFFGTVAQILASTVAIVVIATR